MNKIVLKATHWDGRFFQLCKLIASWSEDQSRKIGSVILGPAHDIRATGYNGLPRGVSANIFARHDKTDGEKYFWFEHAERNAIYNAARAGTSIEGCVLYSTLFPCADCARAIVQSGIITLNTFASPENDPTYARSFKVATELMSEGGVEVRVFADDI